jgi:hypothetical protein
MSYVFPIHVIELDDHVCGMSIGTRVYTLQQIWRYMTFLFHHRLLKTRHRTTSVMILTFVMYLAIVMDQPIL